jgi:RNA polymerase sigma factor (sigma-70 family)
VAAGSFYYPGRDWPARGRGLVVAQELVLAGQVADAGVCAVALADGVGWHRDAGGVEGGDADGNVHHGLLDLAQLAPALRVTRGERSRLPEKRSSNQCLGVSVLTERLAESGQAGPERSVDDVEPPGPADGRSRLSDADMIRASLRDPSRFGEIFDRYADDILRYANARLGSDLAEDVTAETFLAAFRARSRYDLSRGNARPWLYGIAIRQIGKHARAERRYRDALSRVQAEMVAADFGDRVADRVTAEQLRPRLAAVLSGLPRQDRELLLLVAWADLTYEESAQALGISLSAVKSRLHRIRKQTRQALGETNPALPDDDIAITPQKNQQTCHG